MLKNHKLNYVVIVFISLALGACASNAESSKANATPPSQGFNVAVITATPPATKTLTPTTTFTATPTSTFTTSPTATPTPTSTLAFPVEMATPLPDGLQMLTSNNVTDIRELVRTGFPIIRGSWISGDGQLGFVGTTAGMVVYDLVTNQVIKRIDAVTPPQKYFPDPRFSVNTEGSRFSISTNEHVEVWDLDKGLIFNLLFEKDEYPDSPPRVTISPDGKLLAIPRHGIAPEGWETIIITLYDIDSGQVLGDQPSIQGQNFIFSPNGNWLLTTWEGLGGGVLWRTSDWSKVIDIMTNSSQLIRAFSPDDQFVAVQDDNSVLIYQVEEWELIRQINIKIPNSRHQSATLFSPDSSKIGIRSQDNISIWDIATGDRLGEYPGNYPNSEAPWTLSNDGIPTQIQIPQQVYQFVSIPKMDDGYYLSGSSLHYQYDENTLIILRGYYNYWDRKRINISCITPFGGISTCQESSEPIVVNDDGGLLFLRSTDEKNVFEVRRLFDDSTVSIGQIRSNADHISPLWFSGDNKYLLLSQTSSTTLSNNSEIWDITSGSLIKRWTGYITNVSYNSEKNILAFVLQKNSGNRVTGDDLVVYDVSNNRALYNQGSNDLATFIALSFAPDGKLIYSIGRHEQNESIVEFFVLDTDTQKSSPLGLSINMEDYYYFDSIAFSPNGELLAVGTPGGNIRIYETNSYKEIFTWKAHNGSLTDLEFTDAGNLLISASLNEWRGDGYVKVWGVWP